MFDYFIDCFEKPALEVLPFFLLYLRCLCFSLDIGEKQPNSVVKDVTKAHFLFFHSRGQQTVAGGLCVSLEWLGVVFTF